MFRLSLAAVAAALAICAAPNARADVFQSQSAPGMCLNVAVGGASIQPCDGSRLQDIVVIDRPEDGGVVLFVTPSCLIMPRENEMIGTYNCLASKDDSIPPQASFQLGGDGSISNGGLCVDIKGQGRKAGTRVIAFRCNAQANQRWTRAETGTTVNQALDGMQEANQKARLSVNSAPSLCMSVSANGGAELLPCSAAPAFSIRADGGLSAIFLVNAETKTLLFLSTQGQQGQQLTFQKLASFDQLDATMGWGFTPTGLLRNQAGLCADAKGSGNRAGTPIILFKCSGNPNQRFTPIGE